jgi:hypothetical protein
LGKPFGVAVNGQVVSCWIVRQSFPLIQHTGWRDTLQRFDRNCVVKKQLTGPKVSNDNFSRRNRYLSRMRNNDKVANGLEQSLAMVIFDAVMSSHGKPVGAFSKVDA